MEMVADAPSKHEEQTCSPSSDGNTSANRTHGSELETASFGTPNAQHNAQSALLRLPAEIRNTIWEHAICGDRIEPGSNLRLMTKNRPVIQDFKVGLPFVCRHVHSETIQLFYAHNTFHFKDGIAMQDWAWKRLSTQLKAVRSVMTTYHGLFFESITDTFPNLEELIIILPSTLVQPCERIKPYLEAILSRSKHVPRLHLEYKWHGNIWVELDISCFLQGYYTVVVA
ncbi:hypothetical protein BDV96DRAFT_643639 [Lophiotrema nucula]|uniref:Uncharacterized protein n=1 Tax=Lophiotrema nucula TaxID=690887 RepID=A0A6A5ZFX5_9PLEO|nr:hypothetical protein BDV96DRAFT_643639 [Lophiotrema nucula]